MAMPAQQTPHYFFIQNPDGTRTQHYGIPPAEYQQIDSAPMAQSAQYGGYDMQMAAGGAYGGLPMEPFTGAGLQAAYPSPYGYPAAVSPYGDPMQLAGGVPQVQSMVLNPSMQMPQMYGQMPPSMQLAGAPPAQESAVHQPAAPEPAPVKPAVPKTGSKLAKKSKKKKSGWSCC